MFYEKNEYKAIKKKTSRDSILCFGKCTGHKGIDEKDPVGILVADNGIFLERAKGEDAIVLMENIQAYKQTESTVVMKTTDPDAKKLTLHIRLKGQRDKVCKVLDKYMPKQTTAE